MSHRCPDQVTLAALPVSASHRELGGQLQFMSIWQNVTSDLRFTLLSSTQAPSQGSPTPSICDALVHLPDPHSYLSPSQAPNPPSLLKLPQFPKEFSPRYQKVINWSTNKMRIKIAIFVGQKWSNNYSFIWFSLINSRQPPPQYATLAAASRLHFKTPKVTYTAQQSLQDSVGLPWHRFSLVGAPHSQNWYLLIHSRYLAPSQHISRKELWGSF